jgi:aminoglycoside phosphotransferase (APT) family kinase protein
VAVEHGCLAYRKLGGAPVDAPWVGTTVGGFLAALHALPSERMAALVPTDLQPLDDWLREAAELYAGNDLAVLRFLASPPPAGEPDPVFSHNDLGAEHILVEDGRITGVIDWTDAAICDRAYDFGLLLRDLGPTALDDALAAYGAEVDLERVWFYARCAAIEDQMYRVFEN